MRSVLSLSIFCCLFLLASCNSGGKVQPTDPEDSSTKSLPNTKDTISFKTFKKWTSAWDKNGRTWMDTASIRYFHLPIVDLKEVLNENAVGSKFYMGLEKKNKGGQEIKLMLVGTRKDGTDLIDYENGNYVYDFSKSCPPFCDDED